MKTDAFHKTQNRITMMVETDVSKLSVFQKIRQFLNEWHLKSSKEKFLILYGIPKFMFNICGVRVLGSCVVDLHSQFGNLVVTYYLSMVTHTLYYWGRKGQFIFGTRCLCGVGIMVASLPLYYKGIGEDRFKFRSLLRFAGDYIYQEKRETSRFGMVCEGGIRKMLRSYAILICTICISMSAVSFGPMYLFMRTGIWITPLGIQFPYADQSDIAFCADLLIQLFVAVLGTLTTVGFELAQIILNNVVEVSADVAELYIIEFNEELIENGGMNLKSHARFRNIMQQIHDVDRFIFGFKDIFYWRTLLGPFALAVGTAYCIFTQYALDFPAGYGSAVASYIELIILCYMGHNVKTANEQIYNALNSIPWYLMTSNKQREMVHLLIRLQNGLKFTIGPLGELNYEMATLFTKRIYQCLMILVEFVK